jgi:hypothetical protein
MRLGQPIRRRWIHNGVGLTIGIIAAVAFVILVVMLFFRMIGTVQAQTVSHVWIVVLHFHVGNIHAAVLPRDHPHAYDADAACKRRIPDIKRRWEKTELPMPEKITCERYEVR